MKSLLFLLALSTLPAYSASKDLSVYFVDVEGGQATLFISPSGETLLIDAGWSGFNGRDADRIVAAAKLAGVKQIDYLLTTHFHIDHAGGVPQLAERIPIKHFIDHGESVEHDAAGTQLYSSYTAARAKGAHIQVKPGDKLPIKGLNWTIVSAAGDLISKPVGSNSGQPNSFCAGFQPRPVDETENARSVGSYVTFGKFRLVDLGDLTWNKEHELVCPNNVLGEVDVYVVTHHGMNMSGSASIVDALHPRVAIMDNGAKKGGTAEAWNVIRDSKGLEDIWQIHYATAAGDKANTAEPMIANMTEAGDAGQYIKLVAHSDGSFDVTNGRNGFAKHYPAK